MEGRQRHNLSRAACAAAADTAAAVGTGGESWTCGAPGRWVGRCGAGSWTGGTLPPVEDVGCWKVWKCLSCLFFLGWLTFLGPHKWRESYSVWFFWVQVFLSSWRCVSDNGASKLIMCESWCFVLHVLNFYLLPCHFKHHYSSCFCFSRGFAWVLPLFIPLQSVKVSTNFGFAEGDVSFFRW